MNKYIGKIRIAALLVGFLSAPLLVSSALAQEQIRLNPDYKAPPEGESIILNDKNFLDGLGEGFDQFLNSEEEPDQYIMLTEPESDEQSFVELGPASDNKAPLLQLNHQFQYDPSLSFSMSPGLIGGGTDAVSSSQRLGGSQVILSLNPSRQQQTPFRQTKSLELMIGSSFINAPYNQYTPIIQNSFSTQRAYNLSLGIGYSGFKLGASFSRNNSILSSELTGFDLGVGYIGDSWSANIRVGEYNRSRQVSIGQDYSFYDNVSAYELGAAYRLFSNVRLTGRFTYYSYGLGADVAPLEDVQSLIFGTNLSF